MPRITAIEPQHNNPQRVNIHLDGEFAFGLARVSAGWLSVGQEIGPEKIAALQSEDAREMAFQKALHFLSFRPRSWQEVRQNLLKRGLPEALVDETLDRLQHSGLVNDQEFARAWVENRNSFHPRSKAALWTELRRKGLSDEILQPILNEMVDEEPLALAAARRYAHRLANQEWVAFRQKLTGFLARRGFPYSIITPIISKVWNEIRAADDGGNPNDKGEPWK